MLIIIKKSAFSRAALIFAAITFTLLAATLTTWNLVATGRAAHAKGDFIVLFQVLIIALLFLVLIYSNLLHQLGDLGCLKRERQRARTPAPVESIEQIFGHDA